MLWVTGGNACVVYDVVFHPQALRLSQSHTWRSKTPKIVGCSHVLAERPRVPCMFARSRSVHHVALLQKYEEDIAKMEAQQCNDVKFINPDVCLMFVRSVLPCAGCSTHAGTPNTLSDRDTMCVPTETFAARFRCENNALCTRHKNLCQRLPGTSVPDVCIVSRSSRLRTRGWLLTLGSVIVCTYCFLYRTPACVQCCQTTRTNLYVSCNVLICVCVCVCTRHSPLMRLR